MSSTKKLEKYSKSFFFFFEKAHDRAFSIACESEQQAKALRDDLYNFRIAYCEAHPGSHDCRMLQEVTLTKSGAVITGEKHR